MKKKTILLTICFLFFLFNCNNSTASEYHNYINKAELNIITNHPAEALRFYHIAFKEVTHPLAKDIYNALLLSISENKKDKAFKFAKALALKGVDALFFLENKKFESLKKNSDQWTEIIQTAKISKERIDLKNKIVLNQIDSLVILCSMAKEKLRTSSLNDSMLRKDATLKIAQCGSLLKDIFEKKGYLTEEIIGVNLINDTTINPLPIFASIIKINLILNEYNSADDSSFNQYLYPALIEDQLDPQVYAILQPEFIRMDLSIRSYFVLENKLYIPAFFYEVLINKKRSEKNLCTIEESLMKSNFQLCNPNTPFIITDYSLYTPDKVNHEEIINHLDRYKIMKAHFPICTNF